MIDNIDFSSNEFFLYLSWMDRKASKEVKKEKKDTDGCQKRAY